MLAFYLLVMVLGLPVVQLLHQGAHHHDGTPTATTQVEVVASSTQSSADDESNCHICHWLKARNHAVVIAHESLMVQSVELESIFQSADPQGLSPAAPSQYLARGPPRVS